MENKRRCIWTGVELFLLDMATASWRVPTAGRDTLEICHCGSGRAECRMRNGETVSLGPGELAIGLQGSWEPEIRLPLSRFLGEVVFL